jgi:hypothetical protein
MPQHHDLKAHRSACTASVSPADYRCCCGLIKSFQHATLQGEPLRPLLEAEAKRLRFSPSELADKLWDDTNIVHSVFGSACYIESSWPSVLYLAWKYSGAAQMRTAYRFCCKSYPMRLCEGGVCCWPSVLYLAWRWAVDLDCGQIQLA